MHPRKLEWKFLFCLLVVLFSINTKAIETTEIDINTWVELLGLKSSKFELPLFEESKIYMDIYRKDTNYKKERIILFHRSEPNKPLQRHDCFLAFAPTGSFTYRLYWGTENVALVMSEIDFSAFYPMV